jgi:hypothetical protein
MTESVIEMVEENVLVATVAEAREVLLARGNLNMHYLMNVPNGTSTGRGVIGELASLIENDIEVVHQRKTLSVAERVLVETVEEIGNIETERAVGVTGGIERLLEIQMTQIGLEREVEREVVEAGTSEAKNDGTAVGTEKTVEVGERDEATKVL